MQLKELGLAAIQNLEKQGELLARIFQAERAKDPSSRATEAARSNVIALRHTLTQLYGNAEVWRLPQSAFSFPRA